MIRAVGLSKYYGARHALQQCSFQIDSGEIVGLVGKNGAGKSTILKILSGQLLPTEGDALIDGVSVAEGGYAARAKIGYLPEVPPLYREMTVTGYLTFAARLKEVPPQGLPARVRAVIEETGLADAADQRLGTLAKGYQQRVGIAQAIIHSPQVVLLDEPMASLDPIQIVQIRDLILSLRQRHTVLFSSHILSEVTQICERVILLDQGAIKAQGREADIRRDLLQRRRLFLLVRGAPQRLSQVLGGLPRIELSVRPAPGAEGDGLTEAEIVAETDIRERVSRLCVEGGLGLLELREEHHGLEELMLQLLEGGAKRPS